MQSEFNLYIKEKAKKLGRSESSVRSKLYEMGVRATDTEEERNQKISNYLISKKLIAIR